MTPSQQTTTSVQMIEAIYAAFKRGDVTYIVDQVAPNASWRQPKTLPWGGDYTGPQGAAEFFTKLAATMKTVSFEPKENIAAGNEVFSFGEYEGTSVKTGKSARARWAFRWRIEGGKSGACDGYMDTVALVSALSYGH